MENTRKIPKDQLQYDEAIPPGLNGLKPSAPHDGATGCTYL
jgi:hypothetical protein